MKIVIIAFQTLSLLFLVGTASRAELTADAINTIRLTEQDIPQGFAFGTLPDRVRRVLKSNPAFMDRSAIRKVIKDMELYPGGDYTAITAMHVSIIAQRNRMNHDAIVCYIMLYKDGKESNRELEKLKEYVDANKTRSIVITKDNCAVFMFVKDINHFPIAQKLAGIITMRLKK